MYLIRSQHGGHLRGRYSLLFPARSKEIRLRGRLPPRWNNRSLLTRAKPHSARLLANYARLVRPCGPCLTRPTSHQTDAITEAPRLLEIKSARCRLHPSSEILDRVSHHYITRQRHIRRQTLTLLPFAGTNRLPISCRPLTHSGRKHLWLQLGRKRTVCFRIDERIRQSFSMR